MRGWSLAWVLSLAIISGTSNARTARQIVVLHPSSNWSVAYEDNSCALRRSFGDEKHRVFLELDDFDLSGGFRATVASEAFGRSWNSAVVGFEPGEAAPAQHPVHASFPEGRRGLIFDLSLSPGPLKNEAAPFPATDAAASEEGEKARENAITGLFIGAAFDADLDLRTGSMSAPMEALRKCVDDLGRTIGLDPPALKKVTVAPKPIHEAAWAAKVSYAYPAAALQAGVSASVYFRLIVDAAGKVTNCYARPEGQLPDFGASACAIFKSDATFEPAQEADGNAVPSVYVLWVNWRLF